MQATIREFLEKNHIPGSAGFLVTVSGGPDSIALLHLFRYMNLRIWAVHCNFRLRGRESDMDEQFVKRFCDTYGIGLSVKHFDTTAYATEKGISIEMAARELRYQWFAEMKEKKGMDYIVTGHHADDVAETVCINLCRGTGIKGLSGIRAVNGDIIRPLLSCSRTDILSYLETHQLGYRTDSTNNSLDYVRNKIRHKVIPVFKEINPSFLATMQENCETLKESEALYLYAVDKLKSQVTEHQDGELLIHIDRLSATPAPFTLLYEILKPFCFNKTQIRNILDSQESEPGKQFKAGDYLLTKDRNVWRLFDNSIQTKVSLQVEKEGEIPVQNSTYLFEIRPMEENFLIPADTSVACLDADKAPFPLTIRNWEPGDRFCPIGMKKLQKKLSDFFTDRKFTAKQKKECLVLLVGDKIAWIIGHRIDDRFKITSATRNILFIRPV